MTPPEDLAANVRAYLRRHEWTEDDDGAVGSMWHQGGARGTSREIAVPFSIIPNSTEWRGLIERLALIEGRPSVDIAFQIENLYVDVTRFRAANDLVIGGSIPLTAGVDLVESAYRLIRASATTARRPRAHIAGGFSNLGDEIVGQARLGHTERGSYVVPVLITLSRQAPEKQDNLWHNRAGIDRVAPESPERRVTRTLAQGLTALQTRIVEPARMPKAADMPLLVAAGASREMVIAINHVLSDPAVAEFETVFTWASGVTAPAVVPNRIAIPSDAIELLTHAARLLLDTRRDSSERITGPIVEVRHVPEDPLGEVAVQTMRRGRPAEVRVRLNEDQLDLSHEWMRTARTVLVEGRIQRDPGKPLRIDKPSAFYPLDETYLALATGQETSQGLTVRS
jgi:hypothetical protein